MAATRLEANIASAANMPNAAKLKLTDAASTPTTASANQRSLLRTQFVERLQCGSDLLAVLGIRIHILKLARQRDILRS